MSIEIKEESRKIIYVDGVERGQFRMNGSLKMLITTEAGYGDLEQVFEGNPPIL